MLDYITLSDIIDYVNHLPKRFWAQICLTELNGAPATYKLMRFNQCLELAQDDLPFIVCGLLVDYVLAIEEFSTVANLPQYNLLTYTQEYRRIMTEFQVDGSTEFNGPLAYKAYDLYDGTYQVLIQQLGCSVEAPNIAELLVDFYGWLFNALVDLVSIGYQPFIEQVLCELTSNLFF